MGNDRIRIGPTSTRTFGRPDEREDISYYTCRHSMIDIINPDKFGGPSEVWGYQFNVGFQLQYIIL